MSQQPDEKKSTATNKRRLKPPKAAAAQTPAVDPEKSNFAHTFVPTEPEKEPMKRLTILVTESQHQRLKMAALKQKRTMTDVLTEYIDTIEG